MVICFWFVSIPIVGLIQIFFRRRELGSEEKKQRKILKK